jgi:hypothetical protein
VAGQARHTGNVPTLNTEHRTPNTEHQTPNTNTEHQIPNTEHRTANTAKHRTPHQKTSRSDWTFKRHQQQYGKIQRREISWSKGTQKNNTNKSSVQKHMTTVTFYSALHM